MSNRPSSDGTVRGKDDYQIMAVKKKATRKKAARKKTTRRKVAKKA
jgi:hypothetical protein